MIWRPQSTPTRYLLLLVPLLGLVLALWLWGLLVARAQAVQYDGGVFLLGLAFFLALVLAGMGAYIAWCGLSMRYELEAHHLSLRCGFVRVRVPYASITALHGVGTSLVERPAEVRWQRGSAIIPGYVVGVGRSPQLGRVFSIATTPAQSQLFAVTPGLTLGLSPQDRDRFARQLAARIDDAADADDAPAGPPIVETSPLGRLGAPIWSDRATRTLMLAALASNALLWAYLALAYTHLPERVAIHWNAAAQVDRIGDPSELLSLPLFALAMWLANTLLARWTHPRQRAASLFLLSGALAAQLFFLAALLSIVAKNT
jgi:Domain of unknown function (DUF1648)/Bacterial PH domain